MIARSLLRRSKNATWISKVGLLAWFVVYDSKIGWVDSLWVMQATFPRHTGVVDVLLEAYLQNKIINNTYQKALCEHRASIFCCSD